MENKNELTIQGVEFTNFKDVKQEVANILASCNLEEINIDNVGEAKKTRAILNKMKKSISTQRIAIKNEVMKPYNICESLCKELDSDIDAYSSLIDEGVKKVEEAFRQARKRYIISLYQGYNLEVNLDWFIQPKWLNQSESDKKIEKEVVEYAEAINGCIATLKSMNHKFEFEMLEVFNKTISFEKAIAEGNTLLDNKKRKEELARQEREEAKALEEEMRAVGSLGIDESITEDGEVEKIEKIVIELNNIPSINEIIIQCCINNNINWSLR